MPTNMPLNLGLNDGTYAPASCLEVLARYRTRTSLRNYPTADNRPLRERIAALDGVAPENVHLGNGSGPLLKLGIPHLLRSQIRSSLRRTVRHLARRGGYPVVTTELTYFKVPLGLEKMRMPVRFLPLRAEKGFALDEGTIRGALDEEDGLVYLVNPNNPTGNVLVTAERLEGLLRDYPRSTFWIDEAYVHYVPPERYTPIAPLVTRFSNLVVSRSFSFAFGLAAARIGYLLAPRALVEELSRAVTPYCLGGLQEELALAALADEEHLPFIRRETAEQRRAILDGLRGLPVRMWDSDANFVLGRRLDGRPASELASLVAARGIRIKTFTPVYGRRFDDLFRFTVGLGPENERLVQECRSAFAGRGRSVSSAPASSRAEALA